MRNTINWKHLQNCEYLWVTGVKLNTLGCFSMFLFMYFFRILTKENSCCLFQLTLMWTKTLCVFLSSLDVSYITCGALWLSGVLVGPDVEAAAAAGATLLLGGRGQRRLRPPAGRLHLAVDPQWRPLQFFLELLRPDNLAGLIQSGRDAKRVSGSGKKRLRAKSWPSLLHRLEWKSCRCEVKGLHLSTAVAVARRSSGPGERCCLQRALDFQ